MSEASAYFDGEGAVQQTLRRVARRLDDLGIPYAVVGGLALFSHGFRRFTEDVDLLVTADGLRTIHEKLDGLGYVPPFVGSKQLRDAELGVRIEFLVTGQFPGDGKPKPVAFPDPAGSVVERDGIKYLNLPALVNLKLASGMTNIGRLKDLSDVLELIKALSLPRDFAAQLAPYVQSKFEELWDSLRAVPRRFMTIWRNKFLTTEATTLREMAATLRGAAETLESMLVDGVTLDPAGGTSEDHAYLVTTDPDVAKKYDMQDESEFFGNGDTEDDAESRSDET